MNLLTSFASNEHERQHWPYLCEGSGPRCKSQILDPESYVMDPPTRTLGIHLKQE